MPGPQQVADDFGGIPAAPVEPAQAPTQAPAPVADDFGGVRAVPAEPPAPQPLGGSARGRQLIEAKRASDRTLLESQGVFLPEEPAPSPDEQRHAEILDWFDRNDKLNAEDAHQVARIAVASGHDAEYVADNLALLKPIYQARGLDYWQGLAAAHPDLAQWAAADPARFHQVKDDSATLAGLDVLVGGRTTTMPSSAGRKALTGAQAEGAAFAGQTLEVAPVWAAILRDAAKSTWASLLKTGADLFAPSVDPSSSALRQQLLQAGYDEARHGALPPLAPLPRNEALDKRIADLYADSSNRDYGPTSRTLVGRIAYAPAKMAPFIAGNVAAGAAGTAAAGPSGGLAAMFAFNYTQIYGPLANELEQLTDEKGHKIDRELADHYAAAASLVGAGVQTVGVGPIISKLGGAALLEKPTVDAAAAALADESFVAALGRVALHAGKDTTQGAFAMALADVASQVAEEKAREVVDPAHRLDWTAGIGRFVDTLKASFVDFMAVSAFGGAKTLLRDRGARAAALSDANRLRALTDQAAASKLLQASPEQAAELVAAMRKGAGLKDGDPVDTVYATLPEWQTYWQEQRLDPREVAAQLGAGEAYDAAVAEKAEVLPIPVEQYLTKLAVGQNGRHAQALAPDLKLSADVNTPRQEAAEMTRRAERVRERAAVEPDAMEVGQRRVFDEYRRQAVEAGEDESVATANAQQFSAALAVLAERAGRGETAWDLWEQHPVNIDSPRGRRARERAHYADALADFDAHPAARAWAFLRGGVGQEGGAETAGAPAASPEPLEALRSGLREKALAAGEAEVPEAVRARVEKAQAKVDQLEAKVTGGSASEPLARRSATKRAPVVIEADPEGGASVRLHEGEGEATHEVRLPAWLDAQDFGEHRAAWEWTWSALGGPDAPEQAQKLVYGYMRPSIEDGAEGPSKLGIMQAWAAGRLTQGKGGRGYAAVREALDRWAREPEATRAQDPIDPRAWSGLVSSLRYDQKWVSSGAHLNKKKVEAFDRWLRDTETELDPSRPTYLERPPEWYAKRGEAEVAPAKDAERLAEARQQLAAANAEARAAALQASKVAPKLEATATAKILGKESKKLPTEEGGIHPDELAKAVGAESGEQLLRDMVARADRTRWAKMEASVRAAKGQLTRRDQAPEASRALTDRWHAMSPDERAREFYVDANTGLLNGRGFEHLPPDPERPLVGHVSIEGTKWLQDHPETGHAAGDLLYRMAARALQEVAPEASPAKVGGDFAVRVKDAAELEAIVARLNEAMPVKGFAATGVAGETLQAAQAEHIALKNRLEAAGERAVRGQRPLGLPEGTEPQQVVLPQERAAAALPEALAKRHGALKPKEAFRATYVEKGTGALTSEGWNGIPRKAHQVSIDLDGLKAYNARLGEAGGDVVLEAFGKIAHDEGGHLFNFAHLHGDEYKAESDDRGSLERFVARLEAESDNVRAVVEAEDGSLHELRGIHFGRGIGASDGEAEAALATHKLERAAAGKRGPAADARRLRLVSEEEAGSREPLVPGPADLAQGRGRAASGRGVEQDYAGPPEGARQVAAQQRLAQDTRRVAETPAFKAWFGESKVVDAGGEPLVVYHGADADFDRFAPHLLGFNTGAKSAKGGFFFTNNPRAAGLYSVHDSSTLLGYGGFLAGEDPPHLLAAFEQTPEYRRWREAHAAAAPKLDAFWARDRVTPRWTPQERAAFWDREVAPLTAEEQKAKEALDATSEYEALRVARRDARERAENDNVVEAGIRARDALSERLKKELREGTITSEERDQIRQLLRQEQPLIGDGPPAGKRVDASSLTSFAKELLAELRPLWTKYVEGKDFAYSLEWSNMAAAGGDRASGEEWDAKKEAPAANIMPVFLSLQNPLIHDQTTPYRDITFAELLDKARAEGHDGLIIRNTSDPLPMDVYVALRPEQIKSATGNRGTFDPANPSILYQDENLSARVVLEAGGRGKVEGPRGNVEFSVPGDAAEPMRFNVNLFNSDRSTLAHETFHVLSHVLGRVAERADAPAELKADYQKLLDAMGYADHAERVAKPEPKKEEKATHLWEMYLAEGEAPSAALRGAFANFRRWMKRIYENLQGIQAQYREKYGEDLQLSDGVRGVFDRLLAGEKEIAEARKEAEPRPPADLAAMTPEERAQYDAADAASSETAETDWVRRAAEDDQREVRRDAKRRGEEIRADVEREVAGSDKVYTALAYLQRGEVPGYPGVAKLLADEKGQPVKLSRAAAVQLVGAEAAAALPKGIFARGKGGESPERIASHLGFDSGTALLQAIAGKDFGGAVADALRQRVEAEFGPALLDDPQRAAGAAQAALRNEDSAKKLFLRLGAIARQLDPSVQRRLQGLSPDAMREVAHDRLMSKPIRQISPDRYAAQERAAFGRANDAWADGRKEAAWNEVEAQAWHQAFGSEAAEIRELVDKAEEKVRATAGDAWRAEVGKASPSYLKGHDALLAALGLGPAPEGQSLPEALISMLMQLARDAASVTIEQETNDAGDPVGEPRFYSPNYDVEVLQDLVRQPRSWSELTPTEALNVRDALQHLRHVSNAQNEMTLEGRRVDRRMVVDEAIAAAEKNLPKQPGIPRDPALVDTVRRNARLIGQSIDALLADIATIAHRLDGGDRDGVWHRVLLDGRLAARDKREALTKRFLVSLTKAFEEGGLDRERLGERIDLSQELPLSPELAQTWDDSPVTRSNLIMMALNLGNDSNAERLLGGYGWSRDQVVAALEKHLNGDEARWVNSVWDALERGGADEGPSLYEEMAAAHRADEGLDPQKIKAVPFSLHLATGETVEMTGGYFPARYDPRPGSIKKTGEKQVAQDVADFFAGNYQRYPSVAAPHAKARAAHFQDLVNLNWGIVPAHVSQVIQDIAFRRYVKETAAFLLDSRLNNVLAQRLGEEGSKVLRPWLQAVANVAADSVPEQLRRVDRFWAGFKSKAAVAALGWSIPRAISDLTDPLVGVAAGLVDARYLSQATVKIGAALARSAGAGDGPTYGDLRKFVLEHSGEARARIDNVAGHFRRELGAMGGAGALENPLLRGARETAFYTMELVDRLVITPMFLARYEQSKAEYAKQGFAEEESHAKAVRDADDVLRKVMPPHDIADKPALIRDRRALGSLLLFYGHANKIFNLFRRDAYDMAQAFRSDEASVGNKAGAVAQFAAHVLAISLVNGVLAEYLAGKGQEDGETFGEWFTRKLASSLFYPLPFINAAGDWAAGKLTGNGDTKKLSLRAAPQLGFGLELVNRVGGAAQAALDGDVDEADVVGGMVEAALGFAAGSYLPPRQASKTLGYWKDVYRGAEEPQGPAEFLGKSIYGVDKKGSANLGTDAEQVIDGGR